MKLLAHISLLLLLSLTLPSLCFGKSVLQIVPATTMLKNKNTLSIQYRQPCGSTFQGIVVHHTKKRLKIGILSLQKTPTCAKIGAIKTYSLPHALVKPGIKIEPFTKNFGTFYIKQNSTLDIRRISTKPARSQLLQVVHQTSCLGSNYTVLYPAIRGKLGIGSIEAISKKQGKTMCKKAVGVMTLHGLNIQPNVQVYKLKNKTIPTQQKYKLRIAPILSASVKESQNHLIFPFVRKCNEAPVGIVARNPHKNSSITEIGVLVAHYYNYKCPTQGSKKLISYHKVSKSILPKRSLIKPMNINKQDLTMTPISKHVGSNKKPGKIKYFGGCRKTIGTVIMQDNYKNTRIGILQHQIPTGCKRAVKEVSLKMPYIINKATSRRIVPLTLVTGA